MLILSQECSKQSPLQVKVVSQRHALVSKCSFFCSLKLINTAPEQTSIWFLKPEAFEYFCLLPFQNLLSLTYNKMLRSFHPLSHPPLISISTTPHHLCYLPDFSPSASARMSSFVIPSCLILLQHPPPAPSFALSPPFFPHS